MQTDRTTKLLLAVIAICLLYFVGKDIVTPATAGKMLTDINIVEIDGKRIGSPYAQALAVKIVKK